MVRLKLSDEDHALAVAALIERTPVFLEAPFRCNGLDVARQLYLDYDATARLSEEELAECLANYRKRPMPHLPGRWARPLRAPHHTAHTDTIVRTHATPQEVPTEWALATHGVLILDEIGEFRRSALEALSIQLRRAQPGPSVIMIHTRCSCGKSTCVCPSERQAYWHGRVASLYALSLVLQLEVVTEEAAATRSR